VKYRRIEGQRAVWRGVSTRRTGKAQFHFVSHGTRPAAYGERRHLCTLNGNGDALFIPERQFAHALLSDEHASHYPGQSAFPSEPICGSVSARSRCEPCPDSENTVIFSGCMDFELGGMQPLIKAMPEVMMVSRLMSTWPEIHPLLAAMERESMTRQAGFAGNTRASCRRGRRA
jgi:hypothetical protein